MEKSKLKSVRFWVLTVVFPLITGVFVYGLFERFQAGDVISDFPAHIDAAINGKGYSLMHILLKTTITTFKKSAAISVLMSVITALSVLAVAYLLRVVVKTVSKGKYNTDTYVFYTFSLIVSSLSLFISNIYIPHYWQHFYVAMSTVTQPWHNSTYLLMRLFALGVLAVYFVIAERYYKAKIGIKYFFAFFILLSLANFSKPNFSMAFAPIMLVVLIWDFFKTKTKSFLNAFIFGVLVLLSFWPLIFEAGLVYGDDGSSIIISFERFFGFITNKRYICSIFADLLFPSIVALFVIIYYFKEKDISLRVLLNTWGFYILSVLEALFIAETGPRATHGNFSWGQYFFSLLLYIVSVGYLMVISKKCKKLYSVFFIYLYNIASGMCYFCCLLGFVGVYDNFII